MAVRILLLVEDEKIRELYLRELNTQSVDCLPVSSVAELHTALANEPFQGIFLDVASSARASVAERALIHDILDEFPVVRLRWDAREQASRALVYGTNERMTPMEFVERCCAPFRARTIRKKQRTALNLNALVCADSAIPEDRSEKTVSINASADGIFLYSCKPKTLHEQLWLRLLELDDPSPIHIEIRWNRPWGQAMRLPGFGAKFIGISENQRMQLLNLLSRIPPAFGG